MTLVKNKKNEEIIFVINKINLRLDKKLTYLHMYLHNGMVVSPAADMVSHFFTIF